MAILNNILRGQLKGRIGTTWFAHAKNSKGRPVTRAGSINENPENPKSYKQMDQRARFANSVKFYTRATENFFKFAYEDKKSNESDYNAFMRHNIDRSLVLPKASVDNVLFPALGNNWQLSQGSVSVAKVCFWNYNSTSTPSFILESNGKLEGTTVGELSKSMIEYDAYKKGDIVTIVLVSSYVNTYNNETLDDVYTAPLWQIYQFVVNENDKTQFQEIPHVGHGAFTLNTDTKLQGLVFTLEDKDYSGWGAVVVTRKVNNSIKATTTFLEPNIVARNLAAKYQSQDAINSALATWGAKDAAILKGGVATRTGTEDSEDTAVPAKITSVNNGPVPYQQNGQLVDHQTITVVGTHLSTDAPITAQPNIVNIQDFEVNDERTEASFQLLKGNSYGDYSVRYSGITIINGHSSEGTDA